MYCPHVCKCTCVMQLHRQSQKRCYGWLFTTMWVLGFTPSSSGRRASAETSPGPFCLIFHISIFLVVLRQKAWYLMNSISGANLLEYSLQGNNWKRIIKGSLWRQGPAFHPSFIIPGVLTMEIVPCYRSFYS